VNSVRRDMDRRQRRRCLIGGECGYDTRLKSHEPRGQAAYPRATTGLCWRVSTRGCNAWLRRPPAARADGDPSLEFEYVPGVITRR